MLSPQGRPVFTAKDFGPIIFHDLDAFHRLIGKLYAALQKEKEKNNDPALASIYIYLLRQTHPLYEVLS